MSKQAKRRQHRHPAPAREHGHDSGRSGAPPAFAPVPVRARRDGWTPGRQLAFVNALAACLCVSEACAAVGMSPRSYYDLLARPGSDGFRRAVDAATDVAVQRLEDAVLSRALHGQVEPVFFRGERVGERRRYDNRLALALLRARSPDRYGRWRDRVVQQRGHPDGAAMLLAEATRRLAEDGRTDLAGRPRTNRPPLRTAVAWTGEGHPGQPGQGDGEGPTRLDRAVAAYDRGDDAYGDELMAQVTGVRPRAHS